MKKRSKYQKSKVIATRDPKVRERFYEKTDAEAPLGPNQIASGATQNPDTGLWQMWISTNGLDLLYISANKEEKEAIKDVEQIKIAAAEGILFDEDKTTALFKKLREEGDAEPGILPARVVRSIGRNILHHVIEQG